MTCSEKVASRPGCRDEALRPCRNPVWKDGLCKKHHPELADARWERFLARQKKQHERIAKGGR